MKFFCLVALSLLSVAAHADTTNYPMRCRGGFPSALGFQLFGNGDSMLNVRFKPGTKPASQGLNPGECSWLDRGMRAGEPAQLCQTGLKDVILNSYGIAIQGFTGQQLILQSYSSKSAPWLEKILDTNAYINVSVHSDGSNCMVVTGMLP